MSSQLSIQGVSRVFVSPKGQKTQALTPVDFEVRENDFVTILGPSGCGKSTLLRIVAGLDQPTTGQVLLDGAPVQGPGADRGMVFQSYTLFPWLTVRQNVEFGLKMRGIDKPSRRKKALDWLETNFRPYNPEEELQVGLFRVPVPKVDFGAFREAVRLDPDQLGARFFLGEAALRRGDAVEARTLWTPLIAALDPADPRRADLQRRMPGETE